MQNGDTWFYDLTKGFHTMAELQTMFHSTVGHNCNPILDYAPSPTGRVTAVQGVQYTMFGTMFGMMCSA
jgi:hypothetical protein